MTSSEARARATLCHIADPADTRLNALIDECGAEAVVAAVRSRSLEHRRLDAFAARLADADGEASLAMLAAVGGRVVVPDDPEWPRGLDDLEGRRPYALWVRGPLDLSVLQERSVAIVGARAATQYGVSMATELGHDLCVQGWSIVSGGAYGIDAAAHRGALAAGGATVAVLANGVDQPYPKGNDALLARIAAEGALISELPPGRHPTRQGFLARNRVIAALSSGTVVVEAAVRSGSASTVARALELGREVLGVPGPVTSAMSGGVHALLREGATLVCDASQVVEALDPLTPVVERADLSTARDALGANERRVLDALPARGGADEATIATSCGLDTSEVLRAVGTLLLDGWMVRGSRGWQLTDRAKK